MLWCCKNYQTTVVKDGCQLWPENRSAYQTNRFAVLTSDSNLQKQTVLALMHIFVTKYDINKENLEMYDLTEDVSLNMDLGQ